MKATKKDMMKWIGIYSDGYKVNVPRAIKMVRDDIKFMLQCGSIDEKTFVKSSEWLDKIKVELASK